MPITDRNGSRDDAPFVTVALDSAQAAMKPTGVARVMSRNWHTDHMVREVGFSTPRLAEGAEAPLAKESDRVRDDSHALAPAQYGRVPGPLAQGDRPAGADLEGGR